MLWLGCCTMQGAKSQRHQCWGIFAITTGFKDGSVAHAEPGGKCCAIPDRHAHSCAALSRDTKKSVCHELLELETSVTGKGSPGTTIGTSALSVLGCTPSCPKRFQPHAYACPSWDRATLCRDPAHTCAVRSGLLRPHLLSTRGGTAYMQRGHGSACLDDVCFRQALSFNQCRLRAAEIIIVT